MSWLSLLQLCVPAITLASTAAKVCSNDDPGSRGLPTIWVRALKSCGKERRATIGKRDGANKQAAAYVVFAAITQLENVRL
jgi:hypothetical protein